MRPPTGGMMEGLLVSNSPFLGDFLDPPLLKPGCQRLHLVTSNTLVFNQSSNSLRSQTRGVASPPCAVKDGEMASAGEG